MLTGNKLRQSNIVYFNSFNYANEFSCRFQSCFLGFIQSDINFSFPTMIRIHMTGASTNPEKADFEKDWNCMINCVNAKNFSEMNNLFKLVKRYTLILVIF